VNEPLTNIAKTTTPMSVRNAVGLESKNLFVAELGSMVVNLGLVVVLDNLIPKDIMHQATHVVAKTVISPLQDGIERVMHKFGKLEEFKVDETKTREQRAEVYAHALMVYGSAWLLTWGSKLWMRDYLNNNGIKSSANSVVKKNDGNKLNPFNWSLSDIALVVADEGVHYGSILLMAGNDKVAKVTDEQIKSLQSVLEKTGMLPKKAHEMAAYAVIYEGSNLFGMMAGMGVASAKHSYSPSQKKFHNWKDIVSGQAMSEYPIVSH